MAPPSKEKQQEILKQFRAGLEKQDLIHDGDTIGTDDATLLRFLRARQFDLKAATTMWANCQHWRKTADGIGIDELYRQLDPYDYPERPQVFDCWPLWFHKTDKSGRPLNIHHFGGINMPELYKHITPARFWQTIMVNAESLTREVLPASARAAGRHIDGTFVIVDLQGFGLSQFWQMKNLARDSFQISQDYFPETMAQLAIINAPASFTTIWSFIKPWLAKETLAKIDILGTDYRAVLLRQIPAENLPASLGGTCTCAEAGECKLSNAGPWMERRTVRREKWLRGERTQIGLGMEGADEDDGVADLQEAGQDHEREESMEGTQPEDSIAEEDSEDVFVDALEEPRSDEPDPPPPPEVVPAESQPEPEERQLVADVARSDADAGEVFGKASSAVNAAGETEEKRATPLASSPESAVGPATPPSDSASATSAASMFGSGTSVESEGGTRHHRHSLRNFKIPRVGMNIGKKLKSLSRESSIASS